MNETVTEKTATETTAETLRRHLAENIAEAARVASGVTPDQLSGPTPCAEFDTRTLVNHWVLYTSYGLERRARSEQLSEEMQNRDFTADPDWAAAYAAQLDRALAAWADPAPWEKPVDVGGSEMSAVAVVSLNFAELILHGWDVARATGQEFHCAEGTGELVLGIVAENAEFYREYQGFGEPVEVPAGSSALDRALGLSGRDPHWSA